MELETQQLVGIGRDVSAIARLGGNYGDVALLFERRAEAVLAAIKKAKEERGIGQGKPDTPPGLDKDKPAKPEDKGKPADPGKPDE